MSTTVSLSDAKARLSEVVRGARNHGEETIITVDGEPAARIVPMPSSPRPLSEAEVATFRVLLGGICRLERSTGAFDAVALIAEGRR